MANNVVTILATAVAKSRAPPLDGGSSAIEVLDGGILQPIDPNDGPGRQSPPLIGQPLGIGCEGTAFLGEESLLPEGSFLGLLALGLDLGLLIRLAPETGRLGSDGFFGINPTLLEGLDLLGAKYIAAFCGSFQNVRVQFQSAVLLALTLGEQLVQPIWLATNFGEEIGSALLEKSYGATFLDARGDLTFEGLQGITLLHGRECFVQIGLGGLGLFQNCGQFGQCRRTVTGGEGRVLRDQTSQPGMRRPSLGQDGMQMPVLVL